MHVIAHNNESVELVALASEVFDGGRNEIAFVAYEVGLFRMQTPGYKVDGLRLAPMRQIAAIADQALLYSGH